MLLRADKEISDRDIVELYWARDERAIDETNTKYGRYLSTVKLPYQ